MENSKLISEAQKILKQRNIAVAVVSILLVSNLFLSAAVIFGDKEVVLVPNSLNEEASIVNGKMSPAYIEAITRDVINLMLNTTPSNVEYSAKSILKITHSKFYGSLKTALTARSNDVLNRKISVVFWPQSITPGEDRSSAFVVGKLVTYLGKEEVSNEEKTYLITYVSEGSRPMVLDFHEIDPKAKDDVNGSTKDGGSSEKTTH